MAFHNCFKPSQYFSMVPYAICVSNFCKNMFGFNVSVSSNRSMCSIISVSKKTKRTVNNVRLKSSSVGNDNVLVNETEIKEVTSRNAAQVLEKYDTILLDCDGVLWRTDHITHLPGIVAAMDTLQALGKQILFVTNNSMHARHAYIDKFHQHGFHAPVEDVFCVAYASAVYLQTIIHVSGSVYVIGSPGMSEELSLAGITNFGLGPDPDPVYHNIQDLLEVPLRDDVQAVLVGYDKHFSLNKLFKACSYLSDKKCLYLATNDKEKSVHVSPGRCQPLTGAIVDCVTSAAKRQPEVLGKPDTHLFDCIQATHPGVDRRRCLMIGDSVPVDMGLARAVGMDSALVLTGASSLHTLPSHPGLEPTYFMQSLAVLGAS
ncbi:glycerol-3-phosphate phosphatase-like [Babylonia areolata]|uniref:glycerol-3-phosphate phosphatase-like n=1 Tax=Babylonia areolata TaxID=304850 RepID=UPI003FD032E4